MASPAPAKEESEYKLEPENELRFEVESSSSENGSCEPVEIELKNGFAEMFGTELMKGQRYTFGPGSKVAIFSWQGATLTMLGKPEVAYIAKETPMRFYMNLSAALENWCQKAQSQNQKGPSVMVVGPMDVGKSTLCRILLNYAVRRGRTPLFVDMDCGQGISLPGSLGAIVIERPADIEEGFSLAGPIVYNFGHTGPAGNITLYNMLVARLAQVVQMKMEADNKVKHSGVIINTCGWVKSQGYQAIIKAAHEFEVEVICVLDQERLYNELVRDLPNFVNVIFTPKSGGVVERTRAFRIESRDAKVRQYFYGFKNDLYPHSFDIPFNQLKIYKIGAPQLPDSCMPIGMKSDDNYTKLVQVQPNRELLHHILGVSSCTSSEDNVKVIQSNLLGFVCVTKVDEEKHSITLLSPQPRPLLPSDSLFLLSEVQFMDSH